MTTYLRDKLRVLSLISILFVLYIHSDKIEEMIWNYRCLEFISGMLGCCAVPLFYVISWYLFFLKILDGMKSICAKIPKRKNITDSIYYRMFFFLLFGVIIEITSGISMYVNSSVMPLFDKSIQQIICSIFYDQENGSSYAFLLWFLHDLILIVVTSPIWFLQLKRLR